MPGRIAAIIPIFITIRKILLRMKINVNIKIAIITFSFFRFIKMLDTKYAIATKPEKIAHPKFPAVRNSGIVGICKIPTRMVIQKADLHVLFGSIRWSGLSRQLLSWY